jgi:hypothetical protein
MPPTTRSAHLHPTASHDNGHLPVLKHQSVAMTPNGSGVRDIVCVLGVRAATVIDGLKKSPASIQGHDRLLPRGAPAQGDGILWKGEPAAAAARWRLGGKKSEQRWSRAVLGKTGWQ